LFVNRKINEKEAGDGQLKKLTELEGHGFKYWIQSYKPNFEK